MWTHCDKNCKSGLTRFFFACEWSTSRFMLSIVCNWKKRLFENLLQTQSICVHSIFPRLWFNYRMLQWKMCSYCGQSRWCWCWDSPGILLKGKPSFLLIKTRQFSTKAKRLDTMVHVHVCTHSKRTWHVLQWLQDASGCRTVYSAGLSTSRLGLDLSPHWGLHVKIEVSTFIHSCYASVQSEMVTSQKDPIYKEVKRGLRISVERHCLGAWCHWC